MSDAAARRSASSQLGGAIGDRAADDGAVGNRDARYVAAANGHWGPGAPDPDANRRWVRGAWERFRPFGTGATYVNFQDADEGAERAGGVLRARTSRACASSSAASTRTAPRCGRLPGERG